MESKLKKFIGRQKNILLIIFGIFIIALTFLVIVSALNKIEYRKYIGQEFKVKSVITVSAQGEVFVKPDLAIVNFSVISEQESVVDAMKENTQKMNAIIDFMKENGIEDRDLRTIAFRVNPRYEWHNGDRFHRGDRRVLVGYEVHQSLEVRVRDMDKIGLIIEGGTNLGANQVESLRFTIENKEELIKQAKIQAITKAKAEAEMLALQLDIELIRIINFEKGYQRPLNHRFAFDKYIIEAAIPFAPTPPEIEIGEDRIQVTVFITYEIR